VPSPSDSKAEGLGQGTGTDYDASKSQISLFLTSEEIEVSHYELLYCTVPYRLDSILYSLPFNILIFFSKATFL
jgi:hypothetical protein